MDISLKGHALPACAQDAAALASQGKLTFQTCISCGKSLITPDAAHTYAGWRETQITGTCENCFDALFEGDEE